MSALSVVVYAGPITMGELATAEQVRPPTITRLVRGLEDAGLVTRQRDGNDARVQRVTATATGHRVLREGRERRVARLANSISMLGTGERRELQRAVSLLERLARPESET